MRRTLLLILVPITLMAATGSGCRNTAASTPELGPPVELKTYTVPHGFESEVRSMLRNALGSGESRLGRVDIGPAGKLVVVAPAGIQAGVDQFIRELSDLGEAPPRSVPVTLTYWILAGRPLAGAKPAQFSVVGRDALADVTPALEQIATAQGPTEFTLVERLRLTSVGDQEAQAGGRHATLRQRAGLVQGNIVADLSIRVRQYSMTTQVKLEPDQFIVLGQTGFSPNRDFAGLEWANEPDLTLYYVIATDLRP